MMIMITLRLKGSSSLQDRIEDTKGKKKQLKKKVKERKTGEAAVSHSTTTL